MRIRKLAVELGVDPTLLLGWVRGLGYSRYDDVEQQIPLEVITRVKAWHRELPRQARSAPGAAGPPREPVRPPPAPSPAEADLLHSALKGVVRIAASAAGKKAEKGSGGGKGSANRVAASSAPNPARTAAAAPTPLASDGLADARGLAQGPFAASLLPSRPPPAASSPTPSLKASSPSSPKAASPTLSASASAQQDALYAELRATREAAAALAARQATMAAEIQALAQEKAQLTAALAAAQADRDGLSAERDLLSASLDGIRNATAGHTPLQEVMEKRGLLGADEVAMALRSLLENRRDRDILPHLGTTAPDVLLDVLNRRLVLLTEGDEVPEAVGVVWVSAERSEGDPPSAVRDALRRFATACLVNNLKNIVIVGGSPTYHRVLRQGIDSRLRLRLVPGDARGRPPEVPSADLVVVWASTILDHRVSNAYPGSEVIPARGLSRMLNLAADRIEARARG